ncbi:hypothetical protein EELLY_v1c00560 [Entomoplasma ellychniae]|uniref:Uncharacterized protein n=1 Tax=Entomoplasma ellychniae TaxID=2114 RepID=A0A8E2UCH0_9MOLU|nr:Pr6Pr family membrane protein [Entomoplasma ellychniae]PPE04382.1 hypothetical protein EELLY_v1c00560 [Entomoplasma ellychniae]
MKHIQNNSHTFAFKIENTITKRQNSFKKNKFYWRTLFKILFVLIMTITILDMYIRSSVWNILYVHQINGLLAKGEVITLDDILTYGVLHNARWIAKKEYISTTINFVQASQGLKAIFNPFEQINSLSSYFTVLSNILITVWMYTSLIKPHNESKKGLLSEKASIITATLITITGIIYNAFLRGVSMSSSNAYLWEKILSHVSNEILHTIAPLLFVLYVLFFMKHQNAQKVTFKNFSKTLLVIICILLAYGAYAILRGMIKQTAGTPIDIAYPYFFLQVTNPLILGLPGYVWFVIFIVILIVISLVFSIFYQSIIYLTNKNKLN